MRRFRTIAAAAGLRAAFGLAAWFAALPLSAVRAADPPRRPNIVLILADDKD